MELANRGVVRGIHGHHRVQNGDGAGPLLSPRGRVAPIPDHSVLGKRFRIERFLRGTDVRNQYLASWIDEPGSCFCHECGFDNPEDSATCEQCLSPLGDRRFLLSERWRVHFKPYLEVMEIGLFHSGLARIYDVFEEGQRLFTVSEWVEDPFFVARSAPFDVEQVIHLGQQGCRLLQYLHESGIALSVLTADHLVQHEGELLLHDPEIAVVYPGEVPKTQRLQDLRDFGRIMRAFVPYHLPELASVFEKAYDGRYEYPAHLAEALEAFRTRLRQRRGTLDAAAMSDVGMLRTLNEDNWGWTQVTPDTSLFVVADGMGGHDGGEIASELAVKIVLDGARRRLLDVSARDEKTLAAILGESFGEANNTVKSYAEKHRSDMGTTLSGILVKDQEFAVVANVGDTRTYLVRDDELLQLTEDHSLVANLVTMGKITKDAARNHPHSNILIRTVGKEWDVEVDLFHCLVQPGDVFLICSDGLWGEVPEAEILDIVVRHPDLRDACQALVASANAHGGHDNTTVMLVRIP